MSHDCFDVHMGVIFERILGPTYMLVTLVGWAFFLFAMIKGRKRMRLLTRPGLPLAPSPPKLSILVPAKDEAHQIQVCVESILRQDYPNFELLAIDDRSADGTGEVLDRIAASDPRVRVLHLKHTQIPAGWGGKSFAIDHGVREARGEWLLFVDADVTLEPDVVSQTVAVALTREFDLISLLPRFEGRDFWERLLQPLAGAATGAMFAIALTNTPNHKTAFANGQFLLVKRSAYDAIGGHEAIRGTLSEDVALARKLKDAGFRPRISWADEWASVRMYEGLRGVIRGWGRNFYVGSLGKPWRILAAVLFVLVMFWSFFAALAWGVYRVNHPVEPGSLGGIAWLTASALHLLAITIVLSAMYKMAGQRPWHALLWPLGTAVLLWIFVKSLLLCATKKVEWRGTTYQGATGARAITEAQD